MLTQKQEQFALNIFEGMNQADAYRASYNAENMSDNAIYREASLLMSRPKIAQRIQELRDKAARANIMTAQQRMEWLSNLINNEEEGTNEKLKAIDIMNKMQGEYIQKVVADVDNNVTINIELSDDE